MRPELAGFVGRGAVSWAQVYICRVNASTGINRLPFVVSPVVICLTEKAIGAWRGLVSMLWHTRNLSYN